MILPKFAIGLVSSFFVGFSVLLGGFTSSKTPVSLYLSCAFQSLPYFGTRISTSYPAARYFSRISFAAAIPGSSLSSRSLMDFR